MAPCVYSFVSSSANIDRIELLAKAGAALTLQGANVLLLDLDRDGPGIPNALSALGGRWLFHPAHLFPVGGATSLLDSAPPLEPSGTENVIPLRGLLDPPDHQVTPVLASDDGLPLYEVRGEGRTPLEGRLFLIPAGG